MSNSSSALGPDRLGLSRQQRRFRVGKPDALSAQPLFQELILSLQELDNDQLVGLTQPAATINRNESSGGTEPMPEVYPGPRSNCWTVRDR